ncbi:hypothetical protein CC78DRAFT_540850 [Lojkania enalia]|uniref:JmjC domain-containing histone demethylation protein 1 n=1 Tax=Lojkania enalia TaxID=147567 RepID=A0A9P4N771_9PLEO|nr:hypothetical protein CC78DRAFT_540850 [Didymosphaeria enalia]
MRGTSFKAQYRQAPPPARTPPPPAYEPLSPVLPPAEPSTVGFAGGNDRNTRHRNNSASGVVHRTPIYVDVTHSHHSLPPTASGYEQPLRSAPLPRLNTQHSPALGSPIDALANAAATSMHPNSVYIDASHRSSHGQMSPVAAPPLHMPAERVPKHAYIDDAHYPYSERPTKRARSEYFPSPQYAQHYSRPMTSYKPGLSYNVEQMVDRGVRMYQDNGVAPHYQNNVSAKRLSDAQLLLDFSFGASYSAGAPTPTGKRWSISHPEFQDRPLLQSAESSNSYLVPHSQDPKFTMQSFHANDYNRTATTEATPPTLPTHHNVALAAQIHTPPEESPGDKHSSTLQNSEESKKPKRNQGWPKGKPRGPRSGSAAGKKKKSTPKAKSGSSATNTTIPDQLHSPQSLPADGHEVRQVEAVASALLNEHFSRDVASQTRRHSFANASLPAIGPSDRSSDLPRARSVPPDTSMTITPPRDDAPQTIGGEINGEAHITVCAGCHSSDSHALIGEGEQWINCDGCKGWFHFVCAGFKNEREVRDVDKFYCGGCSPKFGKTTKVRKSARAHTAVDYAGLNEGIMKTSDDNPEHHYIRGFKNGDIVFTKETFARLPPELISAEFLEKTNGFKEPVMITAASNPRYYFPNDRPSQQLSKKVCADDFNEEMYGYEMVPDDGQDQLDMVIPAGLTVRRVAELYGPMERVDVIDVKAQEGEAGKWTMAKWADYYEQEGEKPVRNVISLEVSQSKLGRLIRRPKAVRDLDLQDSVWPEDDRANAPKVQFYCLMSVADCYTDFHIDFGGSSVYYHIIKGRKTFFFIPPTKQNLKKYEDWCLSPRQSHEFLGHQVKECYRVDLYPGDTMLIPSGWIHAVWTPEDSLVIGGNFLTRIHYGMQIKVAEIEKNTKVAKKFRYPFFQKLMWLALLQYIEEDPVPPSVEELLLSGGQFKRSVPIHCEPNKFGHNSDLGPENYNRRYYAKAELEGLPDLANYIWRTVMISLGRIEGITAVTRNAVTKSIPKGHGDPLALAQRFALWIAWKRGNESILQWAHPDSLPPETPDSKGDKKLSAAQVKRMEREAWSDATRERQSTRLRGPDTSPSDVVETTAQSVSMPLTGFLRPTREPTKYLTTPKTSQLGPKRIACDSCRKRRIRCKHKDEIVETARWEAPPAGPINGSAGSGPMSTSWSLGNFIPRRSSDADVPSGSLMRTSAVASPQGVMNGGPISPDVNMDGLANRSGRVKACPDCRKSKRRCIHDENGNVDPVKASEAPIPRGSASKKRRVSDEGVDSASRQDKESGADGGLINGEAHLLDYLQTPSRSTRPTETEHTMSMLTPQENKEAFASGDLMEVDHPSPILDTMIDPMLTSSVNLPTRDTVISSIENSAGNHGEDVAESSHNPEPIETEPPIAEPRTPAAASVAIPNGLDGLGPRKDTNALNSATPDGSRLVIAQPTAVTPNASRSSRITPGGRRSSQTPRSSNRKSTTPKSTPGGKGRQDSKETIKTEPRADADGVNIAETDEDRASLALALQLQMEEHGLRRRSK